MSAGRMVPVLDLDPAAEVVWVDSYSAKVFWARLTDPDGRCAFVCLDLRPESPTRGRLFENARHPTNPDAVLLELGCEAEGFAVSRISRWLDSDAPQTEGFRDEGLDLIRRAFLRLGEPSDEPPNPPLQRPGSSCKLNP